MVSRKRQRVKRCLSLASWRRIRFFIRTSIANKPIVTGIEGDYLVLRIGKEFRKLPFSDLVDVNELNNHKERVI